MPLCSTLEAIKNMFTVCYASDITERSQYLLIQFRAVTTTRPTVYWQLTYRSKIIIRIISKPIISEWNQKTMKCVLSVANGSYNKTTIRLVSFHLHPHAETRQSMYVQRNIETRSHYHCSRGKEISITHFESVFYSLSHPACKGKRRTILSSMACPALPRFSGKEIFNIKCVVIFCKTFRLKRLSF
jgi:hypothetical protein